MPPGFCTPPICWSVTYNFAAMRLIVIKPEDVPNWDDGALLPAGMFANQVAAAQAELNKHANTACDPDCVCVRLHKKALNVKLPPQRVGPHPQGVTDIYMEGITARGWYGLCGPKRYLKIKKGGKWIPVEDLPKEDLLEHLTQGQKGKSGKKKSKSGKKKRKSGKKRR